MTTTTIRFGIDSQVQCSTGVINKRHNYGTLMYQFRSNKCPLPICLNGNRRQGTVRHASSFHLNYSSFPIFDVAANRRYIQCIEGSVDKLSPGGIEQISVEGSRHIGV
jgi:hypothetical protein